MFRRYFVLPKAKNLLPAAAATSRFNFAAVRSNALLHHHQHRQHQQQQQQQTTTSTPKFCAPAVTSAAVLNPARVSLTPQLLEARSHYHSSSADKKSTKESNNNKRNKSRKKSKKSNTSKKSKKSNKKITPDRSISKGTSPKQRRSNSSRGQPPAQLRNTRSTSTAVATTTTTPAAPKQRVPCGFSQERLSSSKETNYESFLFNARKARGDVATFSDMHSVPKNDPFDRCIKCGCTIDEHLTQQQREQEQNRQHVLDMIKQHHGESLHWGTKTAHREAARLSFGMRARDAQMEQVITCFRETFPKATDQRHLPFIVVAATPRQGKTLFGDELSASETARDALCGKQKSSNDNNSIAEVPRVLTASDGRVFNVTFNSRFPYESDDTGAPCTVARAVQAVVIRLICAAANIYKYGGSLGVRDFVAASNMTLADKNNKVRPDVLQFLHETGVLPHGTPALFVFDEITKLTDCILDGQSEDKRTRAIQTFFSRLATLLDNNRAVVLSGFSSKDVTKALGVSDRPVHLVSLWPLRTVQERRPLLVMLAAFLRSSLPLTPLANNSKNNINGSTAIPKKKGADVVSSPTADALFFFEVLKSSPGALGTVLYQIGPTQGTGVVKHVLEIQHSGRIIAHRDEVRRRLIDVLAVMERVGKATTKKDNEDVPAFVRDELSARVINECEKEDCTIAVRRTKDEDAVPTDVFVEPLWLVLAVLGSSINKPVHASRDDEPVVAPVRPVEPLTAAVIDLAGYFTMLRKFACKYVNSSNDTAGKLKGQMLEDAVACGLRIQRSLRSRLHALLPTVETTRSLEHEWLRQEPLVVATNSSNTKDVGDLVEFSTENFTEACFTGKYPCNNQQLRDLRATHPTLGTLASHLCGPTASPTEAVKMLLRPKRNKDGEDSNPLIDLIFHEYVPGTDRKRLIQFWVRVKHTTHHPIIDDRDFNDWCLRNPVPESEAVDERERRYNEKRRERDLTLKPGSHSKDQLPRTFAERDRNRCARELLAGDLFEKQQSYEGGFVNLVHAGLLNELLQDPTCIVDGIVHIVVTPLEIKFKKIEKPQEIEKTQTDNVKRSVDARLGRLLFYSLCVVNPGTAGFENLLSQPVALTAPLMDSHDVDSWMEPVPPVSQWTNYIGVKRGLRSVFDDGSADQGAYLTMVADNEERLQEWEAQRARAPPSQQ